MRKSKVYGNYYKSNTSNNTANNKLVSRKEKNKETWRSWFHLKKKEYKNMKSVLSNKKIKARLRFPAEYDSDTF